MAARTVIVCSVLLSQAYFSDAVPPAVSFVPQSPLVLTPYGSQTGDTGRSLAITCAQPAGGTLKALILTRNSSSSTMVTLLNANVEPPPVGTNGLPVIIGNIQGATAAGSLTQRSITLTYTTASCDHTGLYTCTSTVYEGGLYTTFQASRSYSVTVGPGQAIVTVTSMRTPSKYAWYVVGDVVILTCIVDVGTVDSTFTKIDFVWQFEDRAGSQRFQNYPNLDDIENTETPTAGQRCLTQTRISKLRRNLTIEDSYRQYRCYITKGGQSYADLARSVEITQVKSNLREAGSELTISFNPESPLILTRSESQFGTRRPLVITCSLPGKGELLSMSLFKNTTTGLRTRLMYVSMGGDFGRGGLQRIDAVTGAYVSGNFSQKTVTLTYSQASCDHGGMYTCFSSVSTDLYLHQVDSSSYYTVTGEFCPGRTNVASVNGPSGITWYLLGDVVFYVCTVLVGTFIPSSTSL